MRVRILTRMDGFVQVSDKESFLMTREIVSKEGICVGPSSAMALVGAIKYAEKNFTEPKRILVMMPDSGRAYLSKAFNDTWMKENDFLPSPLKEKTVGDLISSRPRQEVITGEVGDSVLEAVEKLKKHGISQLPIFNGDTLVGVLDETDLLLPLATGQLKPEEPILHLIQGSVVWVERTDDLQRLAEHFQQGFVALVRGDADQIHILTKIDLLDYLGQAN